MKLSDISFTVGELHYVCGKIKSIKYSFIILNVHDNCKVSYVRLKNNKSLKAS